MRQLSAPFATLVLIAALNAPCVRAALPDWSGTWEVEGERMGVSGIVETPHPDLLRVFGGSPPYTPAEEAAFRVRGEAIREFRATNPVRVCTWGFPMVMLESPLYFEVLATPFETAMIFSGREIRHIYTDGRPHPPADELWPTHWGSSVGHWEGQTLVIDTVSAGANIGTGTGMLKPEESIIFVWDGTGWRQLVAVLDANARYLERVRMVSPGVLEDQMTIVDPSQFTGSWRLTHRYRHVPGVTRMMHEDCEGNDRNPIVNGTFTLK
jgi:hypothetical protein